MLVFILCLFNDINYPQIIKLDFQQTGGIGIVVPFYLGVLFFAVFITYANFLIKNGQVEDRDCFKKQL